MFLITSVKMCKCYTNTKFSNKRIVFLCWAWKGISSLQEPDKGPNWAWVQVHTILEQ